MNHGVESRTRRLPPHPMFGLYDLSFTFFVFLTGVAVIASGASLVIQARYVGGASARWNVFTVVASYFALAILSILIYLNRKITTNRSLRAIPKPFVAIKFGDVPTPVADLVATEYDRACAIAHIAQPRPEPQEGWGTPGTRHEGVHFRRAILETVLRIDTDARSLISSLPPLRPHLPIAQHLKPLATLLTAQDPTCLQRYDRYIQQARYNEKEPTERDYEDCIRLATYICQMLEFYQSQSQGDQNYYVPTA